jgi:hypothetical protein
MRINIRRQRADVVMNEILHAIRPFVDRDAEESIYHALRERLEEHGAEIISDYTRKEAGLPPRGPDGWTIEEMMALEKARLDALYRPFSMLVDKDALKEQET